MFAVIGDVHGCSFTLEKLLNKVWNSYSDIKLYSTGDLVDRGKNSSSVVDIFLETNITPVLGNHDFMFYSYFRRKSSFTATSWSSKDSKFTLADYTINSHKLEKHLDFISTFENFILLENCIISHAGFSYLFKKYFSIKSIDIKGLSKAVNREIENIDGILWYRGKLINVGRLQIVGHTTHDEVTYDEESGVLYIDTTVYLRKKLSAVIIENDTMIDLIDVPTDSRDL